MQGWKSSKRHNENANFYTFEPLQNLIEITFSTKFKFEVGTYVCRYLLQCMYVLIGLYVGTYCMFELLGSYDIKN